MVQLRASDSIKTEVILYLIVDRSAKESFKYSNKASIYLSLYIYVYVCIYMCVCIYTCANSYHLLLLLKG